MPSKKGDTTPFTEPLTRRGQNMPEPADPVVSGLEPQPKRPQGTEPQSAGGSLYKRPSKSLEPGRHPTQHIHPGTTEILASGLRQSEL